MKLNLQKTYISFIITFISIIAFSSSCLAMEDTGASRERKVPVGRTISHEGVPPLQLPSSPHLLSPTEFPDAALREQMIADSVAQHVSFLDPCQSRRKFAFITGITSGIGLELTKKFWRKGINVLGVGRNAKALHSLKEINSQETTTEKSYGNLYIIVADLSTPQGQDSVAPAVKAYLGSDRKLDYVVFNAAVITPVGYEAVFNSPADVIRGTINTNYTANLVLTGALCPYYRHQARLLYVSSVAGKRPGGGTLLYSTTKAALDQLVRCLRRDRALRKEQPLPKSHDLLNNPWEGLELNVAGVNPGNVNTPIHSRDLQGADPIVFPRCEFFQSMKDILTPPDTSAEFMYWLLTQTSIEQFLENEEHNIYDAKLQPLWSPRPVIDPYPSSQSVKSTSGQVSSSALVASPHAALQSPLSVSSAPESPTVGESRDSVKLQTPGKREIEDGLNPSRLTASQPTDAGKV